MPLTASQNLIAKLFGQQPVKIEHFLPNQRMKADGLTALLFARSLSGRSVPTINTCYSPNLLKGQDFCDNQNRSLLSFPISRMEIGMSYILA
jgi:hypothetical protein